MFTMDEQKAMDEVVMCHCIILLSLIIHAEDELELFASIGSSHAKLCELTVSPMPD